jgi:hypothetical protein
MAEGDEENGLNKTNALADVGHHSSRHDDPEEATTTAIHNIVTRPALEKSKSYATANSAVSGGTESTAELKPKPWYRNINPLRWGSIPPIPETRGASREFTASFFSLLLFQWMAPLMTVRPLYLTFYEDANSVSDWLQTSIRAQ